MTSSIKFFLPPRLFSSIIIRLRSIGLIIFDFLLNIFVHHLTKLYRLVKFLSRYIQIFFGVISGNHYSLVNVSDDDFNIGITAYDLFNEKNTIRNLNDADIHDVFHIYLSKLLYESPNQIIEQCMNWGFDTKSIEVLSYIQSEDMKKYSYSTQAAVIKHEQSNTIIIAFRGTEPLDLLQWMADTTTNFIDIVNVFNDDDKIVRVHAGFYSALGLSSFNPSQPIDFNKVTLESPMFIQLLNCLQKNPRNEKKLNISITGHSLGAGLASLFSFVLLSYGYDSSIAAVYTYGQPLVGNRRYAEILNNKLGNRLHRWVNHCDIVPRIPVIELPSLAWYYARTPYSDALEVAANNKQTKSNSFYEPYYHSGLRFKINSNGYLEKDEFIDQGPILACQDRLHLFHINYSIINGMYSLFNVTPLRSLLWFTAPTEMNDHFPGDYARKIKKIVRNRTHF